MEIEWIIVTVLWVCSLSIISAASYYKGYKNGSQTILNSWKTWLLTDEDDE